MVQRDGLALWSRRQGRGYRLVLQRGAARPRVAGVPASPFVFDVDLGTDQQGRTVAVFSRCRLGRDRDFAVPVGCRLRELDPQTGIETALDPGGDPRADLVHPALHAGVVAYAEVLRGGPSRIALKRLGSPRPPRTVKTLAITSPEQVLGIDHEARGFAFAVLGATDPGSSLLYLKRRGRLVALLGAGGFGEENARTLASPSFAGGALYFAYTNRSAARRNGFVVRHDLVTGVTTAARTQGYLTAVAADATDPARRLRIVTDRADVPLGSQHLRRLRDPRFGPPTRKFGLRASVDRSDR